MGLHLTGSSVTQLNNAYVGSGAHYKSRALTDGTDQKAVIDAEIATIQAFGSGTLELPQGTVKYVGTITLGNDGATPPKQGSLRIVGQGAHWSGRGTAPVAGVTTLDITGTDTYGKIKTNGLGLLALEGITFKDSSGGTTPFVYTTNTTLHVRDCAFVGSKSGTSCDQDAIVLGGINQVEGAAGWTDGFQGYGTVIENNFFSGIRTCVKGQAFSNAVRVHRNTVWSNCGNSAGAAIEWNGQPGTGGQSVAGGSIGFNLIEMANYAYGIRLQNVIGMTLASNDFYDQAGTTVANIYLTTTASDNRVVTGYSPSTKMNVLDEGWSNRVEETNGNGEVTHGRRDHTWTGVHTFAGQSGTGPFMADIQGDVAYVATAQGNNPYPRFVVCVRAGTVVTDGVTTNGSNVVTSATAAFATSDVGKPISGTGIPTNAIIVRRVSATTIWISANATADGTGVTFNFGRTQAEQQLIRFERAHVVALGSAPTVAVVGAAGSGATVSLTGTDTAGIITLTTGTGPTAGVQLNVTTNIAYTGTEHPVISAASATAADVNAYGERVSSTVWRIGTGAAALAASTAYKWTYTLIQAA